MITIIIIIINHNPKGDTTPDNGGQTAVVSSLQSKNPPYKNFGACIEFAKRL